MILAELLFLIARVIDSTSAHSNVPNQNKVAIMTFHTLQITNKKQPYNI